MARLAPPGPGQHDNPVLPGLCFHSVDLTYFSMQSSWPLFLLETNEPLYCPPVRPFLPPVGLVSPLCRCSCWVDQDHFAPCEEFTAVSYPSGLPLACSVWWHWYCPIFFWSLLVKHSGVWLAFLTATPGHWSRPAPWARAMWIVCLTFVKYVLIETACLP